MAVMEAGNAVTAAVALRRQLTLVVGVRCACVCVLGVLCVAVGVEYNACVCVLMCARAVELCWRAVPG